MKVVLSSVGNIDHNENPNKPKYGSKDKIVEVISMKEARTKCMKYIDDNDLGGGNWSGGDILDDNGKFLAHISYNGRIWEERNWTPTTKEIIV
jgi:hypothetical protein